MADIPGLVRSYTRILARVPRGHGFNAESAHMFINPRDRDIRIVRINCMAIKLPSDLYGRIAFCNRTRHGNHVARIRRSIANRERPYVRRNYNIMITNIS